MTSGGAALSSDFAHTLPLIPPPHAAERRGEGVREVELDAIDGTAE